MFLIFSFIYFSVEGKALPHSKFFLFFLSCLHNFRCQRFLSTATCHLQPWIFCLSWPWKSHRLEKIKVKNKGNSLPFQVQFILTTSTSPAQKRWRAPQWGLSDLVIWVWILVHFFFFFFKFDCGFWFVRWHDNKFKLWACVEWVINKMGLMDGEIAPMLQNCSAFFLSKCLSLIYCNFKHSGAVNYYYFDIFFLASFFFSSFKITNLFFFFFFSLNHFMQQEKKCERTNDSRRWTEILGDSYFTEQFKIIDNIRKLYLFPL